MATPLVDIVMAAALLKGAAPQPFKDLCGAFRALEAQTLNELAAADTTHEIFRAQGKMKIITQLYKQLADCSELRAEYQRRDQHGRTGSA